MAEMNMQIGLDLGSRRSKLVILGSGNIIEKKMFNSWALARDEVVAAVESARSVYPGSAIAITGYGRSSGSAKLGCPAITEIKAFALGARAVVPDIRTVIDIGGQDAKVIHLFSDGTISDFEMNDRCAAGTGKFFELVALTLGETIESLSETALSSDCAVDISSTCAVFAETEIIGKLADGCSKAALARGVFRAVAQRIANMLNRTGFSEPAILVGGGASECLACELEESIGISIGTHMSGSFFGAVGAALYASNA